jgi:HSP20 family protein
MTIMKWRKPAYASCNPGVNFPSLMDELFASAMWTNEFANYVPSVNISENKESFNMVLSVPGFRKEDIKVELENELLTISGKIHKEGEETPSDEVFSRKEFSRGSFRRSFRLPENADGENCTARQENGILYLSIPKKKPEDKGVKAITIS